MVFQEGRLIAYTLTREKNTWWRLSDPKILGQLRSHMNDSGLIFWPTTAGPSHITPSPDRPQGEGEA